MNNIACHYTNVNSKKAFTKQFSKQSSSIDAPRATIQYEKKSKNIFKKVSLREYPFVQVSQNDIDTFLRSILSLPSQYTKNTHTFLRKIVPLISLRSRFYMSQDMIARIMGCCLKTVTNITNQLHDAGIIIKLYRGVKKTCLYALHPVFIQNAYRWQSRFSSFKSVISLQGMFQFTRDVWVKMNLHFSFYAQYIKGNIKIKNIYSSCKTMQVYEASKIEQEPLLVNHWWKRGGFSELDIQKAPKLEIPFMSDHEKQDIFINKAIEDAGEKFHLTRAGKISLALFPEEIIFKNLKRYEQHCKELSFLYHLSTYEQFSYFGKLCKSSCFDAGIKLNNVHYYALREFHNVPSGTPYVIDVVKNTYKKTEPTKGMYAQSYPTTQQKPKKKVTLEDLKDHPQFKSFYQQVKREELEERVVPQIAAPRPDRSKPHPNGLRILKAIFGNKEEGTKGYEIMKQLEQLEKDATKERDIFIEPAAQDDTIRLIIR